MKRKEIQLLTRREQLTRAKEIYDEITTNGTYTPQQVTEGFYCVHPDQDLPAGFAIRRKFIGYMQYLHAKAMMELEDLFDLPDEIPDPKYYGEHNHDNEDLDFDNAEQTHEENFDEPEIENQMELELIVTKKDSVETIKVPTKNVKKPKRKYTKKKKS